MLHFTLRFPLSDPVAPEMALAGQSAQGLGFAPGSEKLPVSETHAALRADLDPGGLHSRCDKQ